LRAASNVATPDAIHAATAVTAHCDAFLTNDKGYLRVDNLRLQLLDRILAE
jgi:predicted nucleic acid-binding protein